MTSTILSNDESLKGIRRKVPPGYYTRREVSRLTGIGVATLARWRDNGLVTPARTETYGQTVVGLYSEHQVNRLIENPPYQKPGPKEAKT